MEEGVIVSLTLLALVAGTFIHAMIRKTPTLPSRAETSLKELVMQEHCPRSFMLGDGKVHTSFPGRQSIHFEAPPYVNAEDWRDLLEYVYRVMYLRVSWLQGVRRNGNRCVVVFKNTDFNDSTSMGLVDATAGNGDTTLSQRLTNLGVLLALVAALAEEDRAPV